MTDLPLDGFARLGLDELLAQAELLTRFDRKYLLDPDQAAGILRSLDPRTRVLEIDGRRGFHYESVYFDTPDLVSYRQSAHRRRHRFKVRTRSYLDSHQSYLEVKIRGLREATVKDRIAYHPDDHDRLTVTGRAYAGEVLDRWGLDGGVADRLEPTLLTRYQRTTLLPPEPGTRVTLDTRLSLTDGERHLSLPDCVILETKSGPHPCGVDRLLWRAGHRPEPVSKYGTGLAALRGDLPASKWARTLRRYFDKEIPCAV